MPKRPKKAIEHTAAAAKRAHRQYWIESILNKDMQWKQMPASKSSGKIRGTPAHGKICLHWTQKKRMA